VCELRSKDAIGASYLDIFSRARKEISLRQDEHEQHAVTYYFFRIHFFFFRPHPSVLELLTHHKEISTEAQLETYLTHHPEELDNMKLDVVEHRGTGIPSPHASEDK
jgi:hypothetical protein